MYFKIDENVFRVKTNECICINTKNNSIRRGRKIMTLNISRVVVITEKEFNEAKKQAIDGL